MLCCFFYSLEKMECHLHLHVLWQNHHNNLSYRVSRPAATPPRQGGASSCSVVYQAFTLPGFCRPSTACLQQVTPAPDTFLTSIRPLCQLSCVSVLCLSFLCPTSVLILRWLQHFLLRHILTCNHYYLPVHSIQRRSQAAVLRQVPGSWWRFWRWWFRGWWSHQGSS